MTEQDLLENKNADLRDKIISEAAEMIICTEAHKDDDNFGAYRTPTAEQAVAIFNRVQKFQPVTLSMGHKFYHLVNCNASLVESRPYDCNIKFLGDISVGTSSVNRYWCDFTLLKNGSMRFRCNTILNDGSTPTLTYTIPAEDLDGKLLPINKEYYSQNW